MFVGSVSSLNNKQYKQNFKANPESLGKPAKEIAKSAKSKSFWDKVRDVIPNPNDNKISGDDTFSPSGPFSAENLY